MKFGRNLTVFALLAIVGFSGFVANANAAKYDIDPAHSQVSFKIKHLGISTVTGKFDSFAGTLEYDPKRVATSKTEASIDLASINTSQSKRDEHLRSCDFFCTDKFQKMTFTSKMVKPASTGKFQVIGDLSLHGVTKEVILDVEFGGEAKGPDGKDRAAFTATTSLNRKDFGLTWSKLTEAGGILVGDEVRIAIEIEATKN